MQPSEKKLCDLILREYPTPIAYLLRKIQKSGDLQEQVNYTCLLVEFTAQYLGSVAVALYVYNNVPLEWVDDSLFLLLERPYLGSWLRITRLIGQWLPKNNLRVSPFSLCAKFYKDYVRTDLDEEPLAILLQFRNEVRHGSAYVTASSFEPIRATLWQCLQNLDFFSRFELCGRLANEHQNFRFCGVEPLLLLDMPEADRPQVWLQPQGSSEILSLFPLLSCQKSLPLALDFADFKRTEMREICRSMGIAERFRKFEERKLGIYQAQVPRSHRWEIPEVKTLTQAVFHLRKILLCGTPGSGKSSVISHLGDWISKPTIHFCTHLIQRSPVRAHPKVALKSLVRQVLSKIDTLEETVLPQSEALDTWLCFLSCVMEKKQDSRFVFAVDGLFSPHTPWMPESIYEDWLQILSYEFPKNASWIVTANHGLTVPRFYDEMVELTPISQKAFDASFSKPPWQKIAKKDWDKIYEISQGNPLILQKYLASSSTDEMPESLCLYFEQLIYPLHMREDWQKKSLKFLAESENPVTAKELAGSLNVFTPRAEKFLRSVSSVLLKKGPSYMIYHPLLAQYLREFFR